MPAADGLAIETSGLTKRFGHQTVVDAIDLAVPEGSVFGFLGPNGSGKTTTIRMLLGLAYPNAGQVRVLGREIPALAELSLPDVGALVEGPAFYPYLSGRDNLLRYDEVGPEYRRGVSLASSLVGSSRRTAAADRRRRIDNALDRVGLAAAATKKYRAYSLGMRQRLAIAAAVTRPRRLLVLDEPTNGLDPQGTREVRALVRNVATEGSTVFLSSHLLNEVEQVCTHAAIMFAGRIVTQGPIEQLRAAQQRVLRVETLDVSQAASVLARITGVGLTSPDPAAGVVRAELMSAQPEDCNAAMVGAGVRVRSLVTEQPSLEDLFVALTGEGFNVAQ